MSVEAIENQTLSYYKKYDSHSARLDEKRGMQDGRQGLPSSASGEFLFFDAILAEARQHLHRFSLAWLIYMHRLRDNAQQLESQRDEGYDRERKRLIEDKQRSLEELSRTTGPESVASARARIRLQSAEKAFNDIQLEVKRPPRMPTPLLCYAYIAFMVLLAIAEVPINRLAFELFFEESRLISILVSLSVGMVLMYMAHTTGLWFRQAPFHRSLRSRVGHYAGVAFVSTIVILMVYLLAKLRQGYLEFVRNTRDVSLGSLLEGNIGEFVAVSFNVPLDTSGYALIVMNAVIFLVGAMASFARHDPHPDYERADRNLRRAERRAFKLAKRYESVSADKERAFDEQIGYLDRQIATIDERARAIQQEVTSATQRYPQIVDMVSRVVERRVATYKSGNMRSRSDSAVPQCFIGISHEDIMAKLRPNDDQAAEHDDVLDFDKYRGSAE